MREHHVIREVSEWRRLRAVTLHEQGWAEVLIAEALNVNKGTVSRWLAVAKAGGVEALLGHTGAGHPPKLTPEQLVKVPEFLWHGAEAYGYSRRCLDLPSHCSGYSVGTWGFLPQGPRFSFDEGIGLDTANPHCCLDRRRADGA